MEQDITDDSVNRNEWTFLFFGVAFYDYFRNIFTSNNIHKTNCL